MDKHNQTIYYNLLINSGNSQAKGFEDIFLFKPWFAQTISIGNVLLFT